MKERIFVLFVILAGISLALPPMCRAFASVTIYGYTDKPYYKPGDTGTLHFWIYNSGTDDLIFKNLTIYHPWYNPAGFWTGNVTIEARALIGISVPTICIKSLLAPHGASCMQEFSSNFEYQYSFGVRRAPEPGKQ